MTELDREELAAGLALGALDATERAAADQLAARDSRFASAVAAWQTRLAPLAEAIDPLTPPPGLWRQIERALPVMTATAGERSPAIAGQLDRLRQHLAMWRITAMAASAAALVLGALWLGPLVLPVGTETAAERYVALLNGEKGESGFLVTVDASAHRLLIRSLGAEAPQAKAYELWLVKDDGTVPLTLGIIERGTFGTLDMGDEMDGTDWEKGIRLAVSLEPLEGAPSGLSMGPIVYAGNVFRQTP